MKIVAPNFFQTPNDLVDHWLPHLEGVELKVLLVIMRKTFGWHKIRDRISISQLVQLTGSNRTNVCKAIDSLQAKGIILKETVGTVGNEETWYELIVDDSNNSYQYQDGTPPSTTLVPPPVPSRYPQEETIQNTSSKEEEQPSSSFFISEENKKKYEAMKDIKISRKTLDNFVMEKSIDQIETAKKCWVKPGAIPAEFFTSALNEGWSPSSRDEIIKSIRERFKNGQIYNGAECHINVESIAFDRGMKHMQVSLKEKGVCDKIDAMLKSFGIN